MRQQAVGSFSVGQVVEIEGRRCPYEVRAMDALEGGGYELALVPTAGVYSAISEEVYRTRDGIWRTEQLEVVTSARDAQKPTADGTLAPKGTEPCQSCGAPIRWSRTKAGKKTPINPDGSSHWGTCPKAKQWRGKRRSDPQTDDVELVAPDPPEPKSVNDGQLSLF